MVDGFLVGDNGLVGEYVGLFDGALDGDTVVGLFVGSEVGLRVGFLVGSEVGLGVGFLVGSEVGVFVGFDVGVLDGDKDDGACVGADEAITFGVGFKVGSHDGVVEGELDGCSDGFGGKLGSTG